MSIQESWLKRLANRRARSKPETCSPELLSFVKQAPGEKAHIHLRIDSDGSGLLLVNASRILHLNPSAALMAKLSLQEVPIGQVLYELKKRYRVSPERAFNDYTQFNEQLEQLLRPDGACPIHELNLDVIAPFSAHPSAPYRMDLALTYRCNNDCHHCYNARPRTYPELPAFGWKAIIDQLWQIGIPHLVFTGGEPTLFRELPELIAYAQETGMVTGLNTNGRRLSDKDYLQSLVDAGLDHVQITLESHTPEIHDAMVGRAGAWEQTVAGIRAALDTPLYVMTNTTMLQQNAPSLEGTLRFLAELGVPTAGLNALIHAGSGASCGTGIAENKLPPLLHLARELTDKSGQRLIWYTPTQYCNFDPMDLELGVKGCTAALYNMCIEPDGAVIPCQSYYQPLGNLLSDPWESIWNHELALQLRQRRYVAEKCSGCVLLAECGGGCPLSTQQKPHPSALL